MDSPNALHSAGSNCLAASSYPAPDGWNMSSENSTSGACRNSGASRSENGTGRPPADRTAPACARANRRPRLRATHRSGCGIARTTPKSGHVPTTTTAPLPRSRRTALPSRRADGPMPFGLVMSLAPIMITAASGGGPVTNMASIWPDKPFDDAPTIALVLSRIRLPDRSANPRAISTPGTSSAPRAPYPVAVESPNTIRCRSNGTPRCHRSTGPPPGA